MATATVPRRCYKGTESQKAILPLVRRKDALATV